MGSKGFGVFSMGAVLAVSLCLAMSVLFLSHIWLMVVNRTSIEVAYSGRNPYSLSMLANAQQLCGRIGVDWFLPIRPIRPMTDGCNYPKFTAGTPGLCPSKGRERVNININMTDFCVVNTRFEKTRRQLRDDLMTLLIAGHETTAAMLTWTLHELMKPQNRKFLDEIQEEVDGLQGRRPSFEDFTGLTALRNALLEALRLYPEPPLLIRRCIAGDDVPAGPLCKDVSGDTVSFLPGQDIFISTWSLQRSETLWGEDSHDFNPHRWKERLPGKRGWLGYNPEKAGSYPDERAADYAFMPFGAGPRKCVGDQFALLEAEAVLVALMQRFDFAVPETRDPVEITTGATIHTVGGLFCNVSQRTDRSAKRQAKGAAVGRIENTLLSVPSLDFRPELYDALEKAYKQCQEVTKEYSKTFYLGSQLLDKDEQRVVWAIYDWCRNTDELVDGPMAASTTMADLEAWEQRLNRIFSLEGSAEGSDLTELSDLAMRDSVRKPGFSLIQRPFQDMRGGPALGPGMQGLIDPQAVPDDEDRYATFHELEVYCYRVAGTVGIMTLPVLGFDPMQNFTEELQEQTIAAAMSLGVAFQLTNILRDIGEDAQRGRIYVPIEDLNRFGITEDEVLEACNTPGLLVHEQRWKDFMEFEMARCEEEYQKAREGIVGLSEINRLGVMAALYVYGDILTRIRKNKYDNLRRRAYVPFVDKVVLMGKAWLKCQELKEVAEENVRSGRFFTRRKDKH
ncbi:unnamed protein product [Effrenium voratum]|nr:unnamed protein product [Effrenium voratum]